MTISETLLIPHIPGQIWLHEYPVRLAGTRFGARMTIIRLQSGQLILHSPCRITPEIAQEIRALGQVGHIVAPGNFHHLYAASAQTAFPEAKTWVCPGVEKRNPELKYESVLGDVAPTEWLNEIDQVLVQGTRIMREVAMFHRSSRTLILVDLIENFTDTTSYVGGATKFWFKHVMHMWNRPRPAPEYRIGWSDRPAVSQSLQRILAWEFTNIVLSHGDLITHNAHEVAATAWSKMLKR